MNRNFQSALILIKPRHYFLCLSEMNFGLQHQNNIILYKESNFMYVVCIFMLLLSEFQTIYNGTAQHENHGVPRAPHRSSPPRTGTTTVLFCTGMILLSVQPVHTSFKMTRLSPSNLLMYIILLIMKGYKCNAVSTVHMFVGGVPKRKSTKKTSTSREISWF
jgi:hypothetical protein